MKLILKDGTEYNLLSLMSESEIKMIVSDQEELNRVKESLTVENLSEVKCMQSEGIYSVYSAKQYAGKYSILENTEGLIVTFNLQNVDKNEQRFNAIEEAMDTMIMSKLTSSEEV